MACFRRAGAAGISPANQECCIDKPTVAMLRIGEGKVRRLVPVPQSVGSLKRFAVR